MSLLLLRFVRVSFYGVGIQHVTASQDNRV
ncbi:hypothetical protein EV561_106239 [Rhizobium sp. BK376]|nr:hypothetical protein EV561_106239 [Rhizobium sp. BK376]